MPDLSRFDDIGRQPIDTTNFESQLRFLTGSIPLYIHGAVYNNRELYHIWLHLGQAQGGQKAITAVYDLLKGRRTIEMVALMNMTRYDYNRGASVSYTEPRSVWVTIPNELTSHKLDERDAVSMKDFNVIEAHIGDMRSRMGRTDSQFTLLFRATDPAEARYEQLFRHLNHRTFVPYLREWMPHLWQWMRYRSMINEMQSFGPYIGWQVNLLEGDILDHICQEIRVGHLSLGECVATKIAA